MGDNTLLQAVAHSLPDLQTLGGWSGLRLGGKGVPDSSLDGRMQRTLGLADSTLLLAVAHSLPDLQTLGGYTAFARAPEEGAVGHVTDGGRQVGGGGGR